MTTKKTKVAPSNEHDKHNRTSGALSPGGNAAAIITEYGKPFGEQDMQTLYEALNQMTESVSDGDMKRCEKMLVAQAHALQSMFMNFSRRALNQEYQRNLESFFRMALKAQNQCRMTLETLATIKNPPVVFAKQANIAHGPQQVNNGTLGTVPHAPAREEKTIQSNELLTDGVNHGETLDTRGAATAGDANQELETVGAVHRP